MNTFVRSGWLVVFGCYSIATAELEGARLTSARPHMAPLALIQARAQLRGMRLRNVRWDAVLHQNWAVLEDIEHPERPLWAELMDSADALPAASGTSPGSAADAPLATVPLVYVPPVYVPPKQTVAVVHYGDRVTLWHMEKNVRIEASAITEGSAGIGEEVRLKIVGSGTDGDAGWRVTGIVRGPNDVEME
jgi:hypothetical protein